MYREPISMADIVQKYQECKIKANISKLDNLGQSFVKKTRSKLAVNNMFVEVDSSRSCDLDSMREDSAVMDDTAEDPLAHVLAKDLRKHIP